MQKQKKLIKCWWQKGDRIIKKKTSIEEELAKLKVLFAMKDAKNEQLKDAKKQVREKNFESWK